MMGAAMNEPVPPVEKDTLVGVEDEGAKRALRHAVVEAAMRGLRPARRPSRRNPHYRPDPQRDAAGMFAGLCKSTVDVCGQHGAAYLISGEPAAAGRQRAINLATAARDALNEYLAACAALPGQGGHDG